MQLIKKNKIILYLGLPYMVKLHYIFN